MTFRIQQAHSMSQVLQNDGPNMNMVSSYTILGSLGPFRAVLPGHFALKLPRHGGKKRLKALEIAARLWLFGLSVLFRSPYVSRMPAAV